MALGSPQVGNFGFQIGCPPSLQAALSEQLSSCTNAYLLLISRAIRIQRSPLPLALPAARLWVQARIQGSVGRTINPCCKH